MPRYVCVHGHFYQPPRENAWLEEVETQDGAAPYHDWNERITAECYRPNAWSRILDSSGRIVRIVNNYANISFNVGPTLLNWLERHAPEVYAAIVAADRTSRERFSGHGSALAQPYHHSILPLATRSDKELQIAWGIRDFEERFGRSPEGMWFPETAVDLETLDLAAGAGIRFTVLSPYQARRFRRHGTEGWTEPGPGDIPTTRAYSVRLPEGRSISAFFYNGTISSDLAFHGLLHSGSEFADRLASAFDPGPDDEPQLVHVATDGETYGHHHRHGDMALAFALDRLAHRSDLALTNYGEFLERHPPTHEAEVHFPSSWSCAHGVGRWQSNCGCNTGLRPGWSQAWRAPLRAALDAVRDELRPQVARATEPLFTDPRAALLDYVRLVAHRSTERAAQFLDRHAARTLTSAEATTALSLLEIERQIQQMYTSCGWFFDEVSGIETVQVLQYASRALQLARDVLGHPGEEGFRALLAKAPSNLPEIGDARAVYDRTVRPTAISLRNVCAHYALSSLFEEYPDVASVYCYTVRGLERKGATAGTARLAVGRVEVVSEITLESARFTYGALHIGGQNLFGGVRPFLGVGPFRATATELLEAFERGDLPETIRRVDSNFGESTYTLRLLFRDEQRKIVGLLFDSMRDGIEASFRRIYESTVPILRNLASSGAVAPPALRAAAEFYLNELVRRALDKFPPETSQVGERLRELGRLKLSVDTATIGFAWARAAERLMDATTEAPRNLALLQSLRGLIELASAHEVEVDLSRVQNRYFEILEARDRTTPAPGPLGADAWDPEFRALGTALGIGPR